MSAAKTTSRCLIVNADDFGLTSGVNRGIIEAHARGILTSASLMVRYPAAHEAAAYAQAHPEFSVGLHFDAAEWRVRDGEWYAFYQVVDADDADAVADELDRQLAAFAELLDRAPTHLDSHQHMHLSEPARTVLLGRADELGIPLRSCSKTIAYSGGFYGQTGEGDPYPQGVSVEHLIGMIEELPTGWTELGCHPGYAENLDSVYAVEREIELRALYDERVRAAITRAGVQLRSFHDLRA